jgi:hypothetical protein
MRNDNTRKIIRIIALALFAVAAPLAFTPQSGVSMNTACATQDNGSCCYHALAVCGLNGQNYTNKDYHTGSC